jgi:pyruvate dehydrogenase E2 component (dihydrolipoamide acetyltransferase)
VIDFALPELGENVASGDVLRVLVKVGDTVAKDQPVLELETDKATIEVPSSVAGRVMEVKVKVGDKVKVGQAILSVDGAAGDAGAAEAAPKSTASGAPPTPAREQKPQISQAVGANAAAKVPAGDDGPEQPVKGTKRDGSPDNAGVGQDGEQRARDKVVDISRGARQAADQAAPDMPVSPAAPSVRRMARELGVQIDQVSGSGSDGRISVEDVKAHAKRLVTTAGPSGASAAEPLPDFTRWGEIEREPMRPVRRKTAEHLSAAWASIPHVTQHDLADATALEELRKRYAKQVESAGGTLTFTAIAVKIVASALKVFPRFNSSIDLAAGEIIHKRYINIGIAVDTDRGLLVPVIRGADAKGISQISVELAQLSEKARGRKLTLDEMQGGSFSISNLGGIGGGFFTPIVNLPEVAILGIARARVEPVFAEENGQVQPRLMLPLSLSYDHRVIDGADGARFLRWVCEAFEQPFVLAL